MSKSLKTIGIVIGALVGLLVLVAIALGYFLDFNAYKPRVETAASDAFGMEVKVGGRLGIRFFPTLRVTLKDVHIRNRGTEVAAAKEAKIGIDLLSLLHKKVQIDQIALEHASISIERAVDGTFNFDKPEDAQGPQSGINLSKVSFADSTLAYLNRQSGDGFDASDCSLDVRRLRLPGEEGAGIMLKLSFAAELACGQVRSKNYTASDLKFSLAGQDGVFNLDPLTMRVLAGQGSGRIRADYTGTVPVYQINYTLAQFQVAEYLKPLAPKNLAQGLMDFSSTLTMQGETLKALRQSIEGQFSLSAKNVILNGLNLDDEFARYESSQHFNLVDVGALFLAGPIGLAVTKGYNFASIFQESEGRSEIRTLVSNWKVERGMAQARDVAIATNKNRVALHGGLDFVNEHFDGVTVALLDARGCAKVKQEIHGPFSKPVLEKPSVLESLTGPVKNLLKDAEGLLPGGDCKVFYAGSVAHPE